MYFHCYNFHQVLYNVNKNQVKVEQKNIPNNLLVDLYNKLIKNAKERIMEEDNIISKHQEKVDARK